MSKFVTLHGFGSANSGVKLNFEIIGGLEQPANPAENTIWIETDTTINGYKFSNSEPENTVEGLVWICTGSNSGVEFDIVENVKVYPISAEQYISGTWVDKTAKIYLNGAWVDWMVYLYNAGDTCNALTGGWGHFGDFKNQFHPNALEVTGVAAMALNTGTNSSQNWSYAATLNKIDLTPFSILQARVSGGGWAEGFARIGYSNDQDGFIAYKAAINEQEQTIELDISSVKGEWYILFGSNMCQSNAYNYCYEVILL